MRWFLLLLLLPLSTACLQAAGPPRVVDRVDLKRYVGTWYEIARYPNFFQKKCAGGTTATYELRPDGKITVINRCREKDGDTSEARGKAWVVDRTTNAKLKVQFFWPFSGAYWIIELDPDYRWAVVGHPDRKYLWILSRTPALEPAAYDDILRRIAAQGYDLKPIIPTPQP
ncbi:MAG TPA: lipocalin family protein [Acidobacteriota bacterium]|nr:lipocalin family protein [Acidobacteriota bacterium]